MAITKSRFIPSLSEGVFSAILINKNIILVYKRNTFFQKCNTNKRERERKRKRKKEKERFFFIHHSFLFCKHTNFKKVYIEKIYYFSPQKSYFHFPLLRLFWNNVYCKQVFKMKKIEGSRIIIPL